MVVGLRHSCMVGLTAGVRDGVRGCGMNSKLESEESTAAGARAASGYGVGAGGGLGWPGAKGMRSRRRFMLALAW
jgi:hypothetical protein